MNFFLEKLFKIKVFEGEKKILFFKTRVFQVFQVLRRVLNSGFKINRVRVRV